MNDRYLYRAKRFDTGEWVEGNLVWSDDADDDYKAILIPTTDSNMFTRGGARGDLGFENWFRVDPSTICKCTGLRDKNGKMIWENDVVCTPYVDPIFGDIVNDEILDDYTWKVVFVDGGFCVENEDKIINLSSFTNGNHIKAIGNIFDNPELINRTER